MNYKILIALGIVSILGIGILSTGQPSKLPLNDTQPTDETSLSNEDAKPKIEKKTLLNKASHAEVNQHKIIEQKVTAISKPPISSHNVFSDEFVSTKDGQEFVSKKALDDVFKNDTSLLLQRMSDIEYSEVAQIRKDKLNEFIINELKDVTILQQDLECAGKVCALELTYTQSSNQKSIDTISSFSKSYSFQEFTETENGDKKLKALYIATEDPSQLTLAME
ncbi:hypothetical protein AMS58_17985 [Pseudoalteromonas porphyrae]|uniref:hypothetical protein n=1 Tax=Pseudoalteromonas TaxID=53246 RepID=UPI0006BB027F|nr:MULTISPECIES: hypothetical protein [Pseudoalteromonas]KPH93328.1 hypothetical protein AMS58_17985 [Pseudoalteromonas porphyrae]